MSIHQNTGNGQQNQESAKKATRDSLADLIRGTRRSSGRVNSASVNEAVSIMRNSIENSAGEVLGMFNVSPFIGDNFGLGIAGAVCHMALEGTVYYHLIIVAEACDVAPRQAQIGQQTIDIQTVCADAATDEVFGYIETELTQFYKTTDNITEMQDTNMSVLHNVSDSDDVLRYATDSILDLLSISGKLDGFTFAASYLREVSPRATVTYDGGNVMNTEAQPTRNDISVTVTGTIPATTPGESPRVLPLSRVSGYIALNYRKPGYIQTPHGPVMETKQYSPEYIITAAQSLYRANSLENLLFNVYASTVALASDNWLNVFAPKSFTNTNDNWRDIGAINYDLPPTGNPEVDGRKLNTATEAFRQTGLYELATRLIHSELGFAIDIDETGSQSWLTSVFTNLVPEDNSPESIALAKESYDTLINAYDNLTNGLFSQHFEGGDLVLPIVERIHTGTFIDAEGNVRDIRELDYVAALNLLGETEAGLETVYELARTFEEPQVHEEIRLRKRWEIYRKILGDSLTHTGWALRVRFPGKVMSALVSSVHGNNIGISVDGITAVQAVPDRGYNGMEGYGINSSITMGAYQTQQSAYHGVHVQRGRQYI